MKNSKKLMLIALCIAIPVTTKTIDFLTVFNYVAGSWTSLVSTAKEHQTITTVAVCVAIAIVNHKRIASSAQNLHTWMKSKNSFYKCQYEISKKLESKFGVNMNSLMKTDVSVKTFMGNAISSMHNKFSKNK